MSHPMQLQFSFGKEYFPVLKARVSEKINQSYVGECWVCFPQGMLINMMIGQRAKYLAWICVITQVNPIKEYENVYCVQWGSPLVALDKKTRTRYFAWQSTQPLLKTLLLPAFHLSEINIALKKQDHIHTYLEQSNCSDLAFFNRLIDKFSLQYDFEHGTIRIYDDIDFDDENISTYAFVPGLMNERDVMGVHVFQGADRLATAVSNVFELSAGSKFCLSEHPESQYNQSYHVVEIEHQWDGAQTMRYQNKMKLVPLDVHHQAAAVKKIQADASLVLSQTASLNNHLDEQGAYAMQDTSIHRAQAYVGWQGGMHFPLNPNAPVLIAKLEGNPDKPVMMGTLLQGMHDQYIIQSELGNRCLMTESQHTPAIALHTAQLENSMIIQGGEASNGIEIQSKTGGLNVDAKSDFVMKSECDILLDVKEALSLKSSDMVISSTDLLFESADHIHMISHEGCNTDIDKSFSWGVNGHYTHQVNEDVNINVEQQVFIDCENDLQVVASDGAIDLDATDIEMSVGESRLIVKHNGDLIVKAQQVRVMSPTIAWEIGEIKVIPL